MYQMSRSYYSIPSRLEYLSTSGDVAYAVCTAVPASGVEMFVPLGLSYSVNSTAENHYHSHLDQEYLSIPIQREYHFNPLFFLKREKEGRFVGKAEEIREFVEDAFLQVCRYPLSANLKISICSEEQFRLLAPSPNTVGLSINRTRQGLLSEIFVLEGSLGRVMLTLGHEIGHILSATLPDPMLEEAKAYAFSIAWIEKIQEKNIAGLRNALITEIPAVNGLHNLAFTAVQEGLMQGLRAWDIYRNIVHGDLVWEDLTSNPLLDSGSVFQT